MKILIADSVDKQCIDILKNEGFEVVDWSGSSVENIIKEIATADGLIVRSQTKVTAQMLEAAPMLKVVGRAGAGVDNIDVPAATRRGVLVMNTPGGNTISTAEHTMSLMLSLARNIPQANQSLREGKWDRKSFSGVELFEKTLGIVGLGKVGTEVARRSLALGMTVIAFDPIHSSESAAKLGIELVNLDQIFKRSDFISIHSPLTAETKDLINEKTLSRCKQGVRIINCARGGIVNEHDLLRALENGHVAGAALDVFQEEPPRDRSLILHPHVVATPHLGASTEEAQEKVALQIAHQIADFLKERGVTGAVNGEMIRYMFRKEFRPYIELAERLGRLLSQLKVGDLRSVTIMVNGTFLHELSTVLGSVLIKGIFEKMLSEPVNYVNALALAKERGITVHVVQGDDHILYANVIGVEYETAKERRKFSGTVFGNSDLRIIGIDEFHFEMRPYGIFLLYSNLDRPGMLASVSNILANAKINIGGLSLGRYTGGTTALTIIALDETPSQEVITKISTVDGVSDVRLIFL